MRYICLKFKEVGKMWLPCNLQASIRNMKWLFGNLYEGFISLLPWTLGKYTGPILIYGDHSLSQEYVYWRDSNIVYFHIVYFHWAKLESSLSSLKRCHPSCDKVSNIAFKSFCKILHYPEIHISGRLTFPIKGCTYWQVTYLLIWGGPFSRMWEPIGHYYLQTPNLKPQ